MGSLRQSINLLLDLRLIYYVLTKNQVQDWTCWEQTTMIIMKRYFTVSHCDRFGGRLVTCWSEQRTNHHLLDILRDPSDCYVGLIRGFGRQLKNFWEIFFEVDHFDHLPRPKYRLLSFFPVSELLNVWSGALSRSLSFFSLSLVYLCNDFSRCLGQLQFFYWSFL